jgi:hypothetical protein
VLGDPLLQDAQLGSAAGVEEEDDAPPRDLLDDFLLSRLRHGPGGYYAESGHRW